MEFNGSLADMLCSDAIVYPPNVNKERVRQLLCGTDMIAIQQELERMVNWNAFLEEVIWPSCVETYFCFGRNNLFVPVSEGQSAHGYA